MNWQEHEKEYCETVFVKPENSFAFNTYSDASNCVDFYEMVDEIPYKVVKFSSNYYAIPK